MGSCGSRVERTIVDPTAKSLEYHLSAVQTFKLVRLMTALGLSWSDVDRLHSCFNAFDLDKDDNIGHEELLALLGADLSEFSKDLLRVADDDDNGQVDFVEFIVVTTKLCTATEESLCRFAFRMVDKDMSGVLGHDEIMELVSVIYGNADRTANLLEVADIDRSGTLSIGEFINFATTQKSIVHPIFKLQKRLKKKVVGEKFWNDRTKKIRVRYDEVVAHKSTVGDLWGNYASRYTNEKSALASQQYEEAAKMDAVGAGVGKRLRRMSTALIHVSSKHRNSIVNKPGR